MTICESDLARRACHSVTIEWRWRVLWDSGDWYEAGWHPDRYWFALKSVWRQRLWDALNPGKRP